MLILFDFDDTLTSCTWVSRVVAQLTKQKEFTVIKKIIRAQTDLVDTKAANLLRVALKKGKTKIISNAEIAWLNYVLDNFAPQLKELIETEKIDIISARGIHSKVYPDDYFKWKENCFRDVVLSHIRSSGNPKDMIVSIGDGHFERVACKVVANEFNMPYCSLKLLEMPSPNLLAHEIEIVTTLFNDLTAMTPECKAGIMIGAPNLPTFCNDLFLEYNVDRTGMCIYHWSPQIDLVEAKADVESPSSQRTMDEECTNMKEKDCNIIRTACLDVISQAPTCSSIA